MVSRVAPGSLSLSNSLADAPTAPEGKGGEYETAYSELGRRFDPMLNSVLNSPEGYGTELGKFLKDMVGPNGLEPLTSTVSR